MLARKLLETVVVFGAHLDLHKFLAQKPIYFGNLSLIFLLQKLLAARPDFGQLLHFLVSGVVGTCNRGLQAAQRALVMTPTYWGLFWISCTLQT